MLEALKPRHFGRYDVRQRRIRVINKIFSVQHVRGKPLVFKRHITGVGRIAGGVQAEHTPVVFAHLDYLSRISTGQRQVNIKNAPAGRIRRRQRLVGVVGRF